MKIGALDFPHLTWVRDKLPTYGGLYVIGRYDAKGNLLEQLYVGQAKDIRARLIDDSHEGFLRCLQRKRIGEYLGYRTVEITGTSPSDRERRRLEWEEYLIKFLNPPCNRTHAA